ncbi:MAG: ATP-binding cassette domain-containing protein [Candidatus Melainabacteria bacterium]|nr:ATP-binding cassette domain-containing protein [Candidatus Melainabacteria bacterium]
MENAVSVNQLVKNFVLKKRDGLRWSSTQVKAVDGITLAIPKGQSVAFIGPNGAGKSTTIKMLTGILHPTSGDATVLGCIPWKERTRLARRIGVVFGQRSQLWYHLPPRDTFELLSKIYEIKRDLFESRRDMLIERFQLGEFLDTPVRKLSLGQRMRAEVACSLLHGPQVIFLDEPTIGLDVIARQELRDLVREWNQENGVTVFLTSHDAGDIQHVAKRVIVINHGRVVLDDKVSRVRRQYLREKVLSVKYADTPESITLEGVKTLKESGHAFKFEVDTLAVSIERVMTEIMRIGTVVDITIEDPPLEEIIAHIYSAPRVDAGEEEPEEEESEEGAT